MLLKYYGVNFWKFPDDNLCPPIPGRVDYIHYVADLLKASNIDKKATILDIGTGASCIYPILGNSEYDWSFVASDIDLKSIKTAQEIIDKNGLMTSIKLRHQTDVSKIFNGVLNATDKFSTTVCNPPFFKSESEALEATTRKLKNLKMDGNVVRNFSGTHNELWYKGGEKAFLYNYLYESYLFKNQCFWFTTLVSKKDLVRGMQVSLKKLGTTQVKVINMGQGNKISRIVAWTFLTKEEQKDWVV